MTSMEKAELLKKTIYQLYSKEGRSKSYISRLLDINRTTITKKIREWELPEPNPTRHVKPSTKKHIAKHKQQILSLLVCDTSLDEIVERTKVNRGELLDTFFKLDTDLCRAYNNWKKRQQKPLLRTCKYAEIDGEVWKEVLGYSGYEVSTKGRVRQQGKNGSGYYLTQPYFNQEIGLDYVAFVKSSGEIKRLCLPRVIAQTFIPHDSALTKVKHKDGNVRNNSVSNLEWTA